MVPLLPSPGWGRGEGEYRDPGDEVDNKYSRNDSSVHASMIRTVTQVLIGSLY